MPAQIQIKRIRNQLPVRYRYNPWVRGLLLGFAVLVLAYTLLFLLKYVNSETPVFFKILPLLIMFVSLNSTLRHLTSLNSVLFLPDGVRFSYLAKRGLEIPYAKIISLDLEKRITYYLKLLYHDDKGVQRTFTTPASFPKILEIMLNIADLSPQAQLTGMLLKAVEHLRSQWETDATEQV